MNIVFVQIFLLISTVGPGTCPAGDDKAWKIHWPATAQGSNRSVDCTGEGGTTAFGMARRRCGDGGMWGSVDATECESQTVKTVRMKLKVGRLCIHIMCIYACMHAYNIHIYNDFSGMIILVSTVSLSG